MRFFEFVIAIVAIALTYSAFMSRHRDRRSKSDDREAEIEADRLADRERIENLEERVRVLEKIVTDRKASLHRQFSELD
jgi:Flp pilus assembly protein TadB